MKNQTIKIYFPENRIWGIVIDYVAGVLVVQLQKRNGKSDETYVLPSALVPHGNGLWRKIEK